MCFLLESKLIKLISLLKRSFMSIYLKNSTKINLYIRYSVKTWYFVITNLVRTNRKLNHILQKFYPDFKKHSGYIVRRDFYLHPISCQKSILGYVTLLHLALQKHQNQLNCCHFPLMTGKCSQQK